MSARLSYGRVDASGLPQIFLLPGTMHCSPDPALVITVLGSCVAVCLTDRTRGLSGINHFMLPYGEGQSSLRYGDFAIDELIGTMLRLKCRMDTIEAKVFGGAAVLPMNSPENNVGTRNVEIAISRLRAHGIPIVARRTGGKRGLSVRLFTASGDVLVRRIASSVVRQGNEVLPVHDTNRGYARGP